MTAMQEIGNLLVQTLFQLYLLALLLRLILQFSRADFYNPISQFMVKVTSPLLNPLRRIIPGVGGIDMASIVLILLIQMLATTLLVVIQGYSIPNPLSLLIWGALGTIGMVINIYFIAILASIILSWVAPGSYNPIVILLHQLTEPVLKPFRSMLPAMGGLDLSPIFVFLSINVLQIILSHIAATVGLPVAYVIGI